MLLAYVLKFFGYVVNICFKIGICYDVFYLLIVKRLKDYEVVSRKEVFVYKSSRKFMIIFFFMCESSFFIILIRVGKVDEF